MLEFLLSRSALAICATLLIGIITPMFSNTIQSYYEQECRNSLKELAAEIERANSSPFCLTIQLNTDRVLIAENSYLRIMNGSLWLIKDGNHIAVEIPQDIELYAKSKNDMKITSTLEVRSKDKLIIARIAREERLQTIIYSENFDPNSFMISANL
ncbi:MAG: hypothetical protein QW520_06405 [Methanomassiliicoccales archaeon]